MIMSGSPLTRDSARQSNTLLRSLIGPNFAIGFYRKVAGETRMIDYWEGSNKEGMPQTVKAAKDKLFIYGKWFLPHDAEAASIDTGKTRVQTTLSLAQQLTRRFFETQLILCSR